MVQLAPEEIGRAAADFVILAQFKEVADELRENPLFDGVLKDHMVWTDAADAINNAGPLGNKWVFETLPDEILNSDAYAHVTR